MNSFAPGPMDCVSDGVSALTRMPLADFIARWRALTGEPPAIMLDCRSEMLALLVSSMPVAALQLCDSPTNHSAYLLLPS
jgi:hypothetical protein